MKPWSSDLLKWCFCGNRGRKESKVCVFLCALISRAAPSHYSEAAQEFRFSPPREGQTAQIEKQTWISLGFNTNTHTHFGDRILSVTPEFGPSTPAQVLWGVSGSACPAAGALWSQVCCSCAGGGSWAQGSKSHTLLLQPLVIDWEQGWISICWVCRSAGMLIPQLPAAHRRTLLLCN